MSWNSTVTGSALGLLVFLNRIGTKDPKKDLIEEVPDLEIPEAVIDRAHRIGPDYTDKNKVQKLCKSIIVRFTTLSHYASFYRTRGSIGNRAQVRLDLAKRRYDILKAGNEYIKSIMQISNAE